MDVKQSERSLAHLSDEEKIPVEHPENARAKVEIPIYNDVERVDQTDLSFAAILKGTAANPLNTFEKKAALINVELDKFGMGRYQICIWFLCGFGYFLDLAWSQGVGLIASAIYQEMGVSDEHTGDIFAIANAGLAVGALGFGLAVDIIGRKWAFNLTCLITSVFGLLLAAPKYNYPAICAIYFLASLGLGGNIPIDATIALEFLPHNRRFLVALLSMWQPIGVAIASCIAYGTTGQAKWRCDPDAPACPDAPAGVDCCTVDSNMGWRYTVIVLGCMTLAVFFLRYFVFTFHESPKFLLARGKEQEALNVLHRIAKFNKQPAPTLTMEMFAAIDEVSSNATSSARLSTEVPLEVDQGTQDTTEKGNGFQRLKGIFTKKRNATPSARNSTGGARSTKATTKKVIKGFGKELKRLKGIFTNKLTAFTFVLLALAYMGDYWSFNLAGTFLPLILLRNNVDEGRGTVSDTYEQYLIIYFPGIIGAILALASIQLPLVGRKWSLVFSALCQGISMAMYTQVSSTAAYVGLNALEYIMQTYFNAVLYASAPELFDTVYRGSVSGMLSCLGRIAGIVAPFAGAQLLADQSSGILWLGAGGIWLSALLMCFLPVEMKNRQMF
ncbi:sugar transporter-like protein [Alternaria rosae]|uniref:sugar transporter-like protein n=1 Tax=Alternaria rosae TaxID=1187941 RepID=UPI001E8DAED1|nr:sugar transporter-like protein [Alternaria rosae]KAH6882648.1 sugar transporter-like protein [Alternaria rosae]